MRISEWLYYIGPNRRLPCTAIEWHCEFRETDLEALLQARAGGFARLQSMLESLGFAANPVRDLLEPAIRAEIAAIRQTPDVAWSWLNFGSSRFPGQGTSDFTPLLGSSFRRSRRSGYC